MHNGIVAAIAVAAFAGWALGYALGSRQRSGYQPLPGDPPPHLPTTGSGVETIEQRLRRMQ